MPGRNGATVSLSTPIPRPDLEYAALRRHCSIQVQRFGGSYWQTEGLRDRLEELRQRAVDHPEYDPDFPE